MVEMLKRGNVEMLKDYGTSSYGKALENQSQRLILKSEI